MSRRRGQTIAWFVSWLIGSAVTAKLKVMPGKIHSVYGCDDEMSVEALGTAAADFLVLTQTPTRATWLASRGEHRLASAQLNDASPSTFVYDGLSRLRENDTKLWAETRSWSAAKKVMPRKSRTINLTARMTGTTPE